MHFHHQNLNEKRNGKCGPLWRHGRCWLRFREYGRGPEFRLEWQALSGDFRLGVSFRDEESISLSFACGLVSLWFGIDHLRWRWLPSERVCEIYWFEKALWVHPWGRRHEWRKSDPWWVRGFTIHFDDLLLGHAKYSDETLSTKDIVIPMPEGSYPATVRMFESTWKRPRWFARRIIRADVEVPAGIPHDGKGENSWDCGEDATYGMTCQADSVEDAIGRVVASVLRSRRKYGAASDLVPVISHRVVQKQEAQPTQ